MEMISHRGAARNTPSLVGFPRLLCSRALIRGPAFAMLFRKRHDSVPFSVLSQGLTAFRLYPVFREISDSNTASR